MRRGVALSRLLLLLAALAVAVAAQSSGSTSASIFANSSTSNSSSSSSSSKSQCEICRDTGDCSEAYNGAAGQFCHSWLDSSNSRRACCCPAADTCANDSNYACTCQHKSDRPSYWIWIGLGVFAVGALIGGGIFMAMRKRRMQQRRDEYPPQAAVAYTQPVYAPGGYAQQGYAAGQPVYAAQPTYVQPGYYGQGGYRDGYRGGRRGMGTGGAVAMGAAGGLLGGLLIGEALGDMGDGGGGDFGGEQVTAFHLRLLCGELGFDITRNSRAPKSRACSSSSSMTVGASQLFTSSCSG
ncbi:uncharacterized protein IUM83_10839 [Phytophthora cinnamomi]|uniref:uncharacterized protein n=1 Tax=Phytophthora cinnamomi TaxID=4785 RepID=UPI00355A8098|nr:hypothetical protein IUM83_10839 [Phytophthora cinnamomi]